MTPPAYVHILMSRDGDTSACGFAHDAFETEGDHRAAGTYEHGRPGLRVTCPACVEMVRAFREATKGIVLRPLRAVTEEGEIVE